MSFDYELPASVPEEIRQQAESLRNALTELLPRFPEEAVGVGAVWRIRDTLQMPQMSVQMATLYTLRRRDGDQLEVDVRIETGEGGELPQGVQMEVSGTGQQRFALGSLEVIGRVQSNANVHANTAQGRMQIRMQTRTEVRPASAE